MSEALAVTRLQSWPDSRIELTPAARWLTDHGGESMPMEQLFAGFIEKLIEEGIPLLRVTSALPSMHPQVLSRGFIWRRGEPVEVASVGHDVTTSEEYLNSPVWAIHQGAAAIRRRLDIPDAPMDFGILPDLLAIGATDYLALPMRFTQGPGFGSQSPDRPRNVSFASFTTDRPGGFSPAELSYLMELMPLVALRLEIEASRRMTRDLLITYLGRAPAKRVLKGNFHRGRGFEVEAAIWLSDLRGFTAMSDRLDNQEVITVLDDYFEAMARPVQQHEGEVLKFIGDGLLAIFRVDPENTPPGIDPRAHACQRALEAACGAFGALAELNETRVAAGQQPLRAGIGLHLGQVMFGNIGAKDRLDFTVIGRAVNEVARVEAATKMLSRPLVTSDSFARMLPEAGLESLGFHALRGVRQPRELHGVPTERLVCEYSKEPAGESA
ncbi:adenylate/guanylate cyclase domain-containing protein [Ferrovibrio sp.]|uniref:adenylate/guanylate cyclase domain-containing protein n=1 Tax=Ferrovibrio sp. TaxID=1917215 RepID=UPI001B68364C|nr:adenylate/guanylate cyclase domain-containing protein [Ferrovibrio sp.]MBP7062513.1 adenylate/guanylate cyclase domain-containing protein [Ferrovibrio sp.]